MTKGKTYVAPWRIMWRVLCAFAVAQAVYVAIAASLPDTKIEPTAVLARRGSLGKDSYVVTNVPPVAVSYAIGAVGSDGRLRDRCVNTATVDADAATFALPGRRSMAGYARCLILHLNIASTNGCAVSFSGANAIYTTDWDFCTKCQQGRRIFSIMEIADNEYLVESRELEQIQKED